MTRIEQLAVPELWLSFNGRCTHCGRVPRIKFRDFFACRICLDCMTDYLVPSELEEELWP